MKIEIDQSGKIENTHKPTVVGFSNKKNKSVIIFATEKQKVQKYFRKINKPRIFIYATFTVLICLILKSEKDIDEIIIDKEYPGQEALIKSYLLQFLRKTGRDFDRKNISFRQLGKKAKVHKVVINSYRKKSANLKIKSEDILNFLTKTKSGVW